MRTPSTFTVLSLALSLYLASVAQANPAIKALSDQDLFEAHLQQPGSSHKRLPSEVLNHHERDEVPTADLAIAVSASSSSIPTTSTTASSIESSSSSSATPSSVARRFTPDQPSHFIKHRSKKLGKRRLSGSSSHGSVRVERDTDDFPSLWEIPAALARAFEHEDTTSSSTTSLPAVNDAAKIVYEQPCPQAQQVSTLSLLHQLEQQLGSMNMNPKMRR